MQGSDVLLHRRSTNLTIKYNKTILYTMYLLTVSFIEALVAMWPLQLSSFSSSSSSGKWNKQASHKWTYRNELMTEFCQVKRKITIIMRIIIYANNLACHIMSKSIDIYQYPDVTTAVTCKSQKYHNSTINRPNQSFLSLNCHYY